MHHNSVGMAIPTNKTISSLHLSIQSRFDKLKQQCLEVCGGIDNSSLKRIKPATTVQPLQELFSSVQLWKERSLHHTLEALDKADAPSIDSHIEAMENHEKAAKDLFELARVCLDRTWDNVNLYLDAFAEDLAGLVDNIVTSRLDELRLVHENIVNVLREENQKLDKTCQELKGINAGLEQRIEMLENASSVGGDAILCNKLRDRVQHLVIRQHELSMELESAAEERVKHRRDLEKTKAQLAESQKSLALTRAMHEKETRQLAALIQLNHAQVAQIIEASKDVAVKVTGPRHRQQPLERFDPLSGSTIVHLTPASTPQKPRGSPSCNSPRRPSSPAISTWSAPNKQGEPPRQRLERPKSATVRGSRPCSATTTRGGTLSPTKNLRDSQFYD